MYPFMRTTDFALHVLRQLLYEQEQVLAEISHENPTYKSIALKLFGNTLLT